MAAGVTRFSRPRRPYRFILGGEMIDEAQKAKAVAGATESVKEHFPESRLHHIEIEESFIGDDVHLVMRFCLNDPCEHSDDRKSLH